MFSPFTQVALRIFAKGFYRVHSGLLLASLVTVVTYCFFINLLDENHISPEDQILGHLGIVLGMLTSPVMTALIFVLWLLLTVKSWSYVSAQLKIESNQFLRYSSTSLSQWQQFRSWMIVQLAMSMPLIAYGIFALVIGLTFGYYLIPLMTLFYVVLLSFVSAGLYVREGNQRVRSGRASFLSVVVKSWAKPSFSLSLYGLADRQKISLGITKGLSLVIVFGAVWLKNEVDEFQIACFVALGFSTVHALLVWQLHAFETQYLPFTRNFPLTRNRIFGEKFSAIALLVLPEVVWLSVQFGWSTGFFMSGLMIGVLLLYSSALYRRTPDMKRFLYLVFFLFNVLFAVILFGWSLTAVPIILLGSYFLFRRDYYRSV